MAIETGNQICRYCRRPRAELDPMSRCDAARKAGSMPFHCWTTAAELSQSFEAVASRFLKEARRSGWR